MLAPNQFVRFLNGQGRLLVNWQSLGALGRAVARGQFGPAASRAADVGWTQLSGLHHRSQVGFPQDLVVFGRAWRLQAAAFLERGSSHSSVSKLLHSSARKICCI